MKVKVVETESVMWFEAVDYGDVFTTLDEGEPHYFMKTREYKGADYGCAVDFDGYTETFGMKTEVMVVNAEVKIR